MQSSENKLIPAANTKLPGLNKLIFTSITLLVSLFVIYSNSFHGEWHFDDFSNIVNNPQIQLKSFSWPEIKHTIYDTQQNKLWRPFSTLSFALNYKLGGMDVFGFHVVNFIIHYLAAVFLFLFIYNMLRLPLLKIQHENIVYPVALLATFFWALNPIHVTCVSYIVQRYASLAGLFYIMSMYFYLKGRTSENFVSSVLFFILCFTSGLAAVLSKENAAMLPVSILLFDLFLIQGINKENLKKSFSILIIPCLLILIIGFIFTKGFSNFSGSSFLAGYELRDFSILQRLLTEPRVILFYLSLLFYPINSRLTFLYDIEVSRSLLQPWTTLPSILMILSIIGFALCIARKRPLISYCIVFYFLNHIIEGSIFPLELIYEYRNYLPSMLLFVPFAQLIIYVTDYFTYKKVIRFLIIFVTAIILIGEGDITYSRNRIFSNDFLLWLDNVNKSPGLSRPHSNLGIIYFIHNENEKALAEYEKALILNKFGNRKVLAIQYYNIGLLYFDNMQNDLAMDYFRKSSEIIPEDVLNYIYMAKIRLRYNKIKEAKIIIEDKLNKYPHNSELLELYRIILLKEGRIDNAQHFAR